MKRILVYYGENKRAVDQQSVMELFCKMGHEVYLLTQTPKGELHSLVESYGVKTFSYETPGISGPKFFYKHVKHLLDFIKEHQIDVVFAHLQGAGFIAGLARKFKKFELFYVRHNVDVHIIDGNLRDRVLNNWANRLSPKIIAVSTVVEKYLLEVEKVNPKRIRQINYSFNFEQYLKSDYTGKAGEIKTANPAKILILDVGRLVPLKRHPLMIRLVHELRMIGVDARMIILGAGPEEPALKAEIASMGLQNSVVMPGSVRNVLDYLEASDVLVHFSETESLGISVLEAGLMKKPVLVCKNVGVFSSFITNGENGYLVDKDNPVTEAVSIITELAKDAEKRDRIGNALNKIVLDNFDINRVAEKYKAILAE